MTKKKKYKKNYFRLSVILIIIIVIITSIILLIANLAGNSDKSPVLSDSNPKTESPPDIQLVLAEDGTTPVKSPVPIKGTEAGYENSYLVSNPDDYNVIVNKTYNLSPDYKPEDLVHVDVPFAPGRTEDVQVMRKTASDALTDMLSAAEKEKGFIIYGASGYRSYETQRILFEKRLKNYKSFEEANILSALPGQSEHQTGLTIDLAIEELDYKLNSSFGETEEGIWLKDNCYKFGFILRYPEEKEDITKYKYEPWHFRYVGKELAKYIYDNNLTLEEYYGLSVSN